MAMCNGFITAFLYTRQMGCFHGVVKVRADSSVVGVMQ